MVWLLAGFGVYDKWYHLLLNPGNSVGTVTQGLPVHMTDDSRVRVCILYGRRTGIRGDTLGDGFQTGSPENHLDSCKDSPVSKLPVYTWFRSSGFAFRANVPRIEDPASHLRIAKSRGSSAGPINFRYSSAAIWEHPATPTTRARCSRRLRRDRSFQQRPSPSCLLELSRLTSTALLA